MNHIVTFVKEHIALCICTFGLAIVGYLGYRTICWIISKCHTTKKIEEVAQKNIPKPDISFYPPKPLINRISNLELISDKITRGQGEYIVFHQSLGGEKKTVNRETFEEVYKVLLQYSPLALANNGSEKVKEECENRYELLQAKLKEIDPTLQAIFVPRTLYELIFIRKCIQEDVKNNKTCAFLLPFNQCPSLKIFNGDQQKLKDFQTKNQIEQKEKKCWHLSYFSDSGDNQHPGVKEVAYRLNKAIFKKFHPSAEGFTFQEIPSLAAKEIEFLKTHHKKGVEITERWNRNEEVKYISNNSSGYAGPTINFGFENCRGFRVYPMGIRKEEEAQIIQNAIALECSKIAQHSLFLYRGADFETDSIYSRKDKNESYSLSYGSSLFAGSVHDGGATAFHFMRKEKNAYAIPVPFDQVKNSPFFIPITHTITQLFGEGEIFHARTKAWKDFDVKNIGGMNLGTNGHKRGHLQSNLEQQEIVDQFQDYKNKAWQLK